MSAGAVVSPFYGLHCCAVVCCPCHQISWPDGTALFGNILYALVTLSLHWLYTIFTTTGLTMSSLIPSYFAYFTLLSWPRVIVLVGVCSTGNDPFLALIWWFVPSFDTVLTHLFLLLGIITRPQLSSRPVETSCAGPLRVVPLWLGDVTGTCNYSSTHTLYPTFATELPPKKIKVKMIKPNMIIDRCGRGRRR
jgi:hypothetical protein